MINKQFDLLAIGDKRMSGGRTVTETDVVHFCMLTGNWMAAHCDVEYAQKTRFGQRVAQGALVFSIVTALLPFDAEVVEAFYGADVLRFHRPTFIGDTLRASTEIVDLKDRGGSSGLVTIDLRAINQRSEEVMSCKVTTLVRKVRMSA